nr:MAG TPA: hypothetical protein [Caudoviricetes sp.]
MKIWNKKMPVEKTLTRKFFYILYLQLLYHK